MRDRVFKGTIYFFTLFSISLLIIIFVFIYRQAHPFFSDHSLSDFLFGNNWNATETKESYQIFVILLASFYIAALSCAFSFPIALGLSLYISFYAGGRIKKILLWLVRILAGIPSIIYGFFALLVIVKALERLLDMSAGESVLAGATILAIMIVPFFVSSFISTIDLLKDRYKADSDSLGISKEFFIYNIVLKNMKFSIITGFLLAMARALGETMTVMMVIGNAPIMPKLLSKAQTIPSLIALEIGMSEVGSKHYTALFAAGFVLLFLVLILNTLFFALSTKRENSL